MIDQNVITVAIVRDRFEPMRWREGASSSGSGSRDVLDAGAFAGLDTLHHHFFFFFCFFAATTRSRVLQGPLVRWEGEARLHSSDVYDRRSPTNGFEL